MYSFHSRLSVLINYYLYILVLRYPLCTKLTLDSLSKVMWFKNQKCVQYESNMHANN